MNRLFFILLCTPMFLHAQNETGIKWTTGLSWEQIKQKAKAENKYIFVDAYATWCAPCKKMDKTVYANDSIGMFMNPKFICVKAQLDSTKMDSDNIKSWYQDAVLIQKQFDIKDLPAFLYFSPDGQLVHRSVGFHDIRKFRVLSSDAMNPERQYYSLFNKFQQGNRDTSFIKMLSRYAYSLGQKDQSLQIAKEYVAAIKGMKELSKDDIRFIRYYAKSVSLSQTLSEFYLDSYLKDDIEFVNEFTQSSKDKGFSMFYENSDRINKAVGRITYAQDKIDQIVTTEEIEPFLMKMQNVSHKDWKKLTTSISKKYEKQTAQRAVLKAKVRWYEYKEDWPEYIPSVIEDIEKYGVDTTVILTSDYYLNNTAWNIFLHSSNRKYLETALKWIEVVLKRPQPPLEINCLDTYANLLYKLGRKDEAIAQEEKALRLDPTDKDIRAALEKMRKDIPTW